MNGDGSTPTMFSNSYGRWGCGSCAYESLTLEVAPGRVLDANVEYSFRAVVRNPRTDEWLLPQPHALLAPISIAATCSGFATFPSANMQLVHEEREGVTNGSHPLLLSLIHI